MGKSRLPAEDWDEFEQNLARSRKNWKMRDVDFGE